MPIICPTITVDKLADYQQQLDNSVQFATRIHIDISDHTIAPRHLLAINKLSWPDQILADLHLMVQQPETAVVAAIELQPNMVILHSEAEMNLESLIALLHDSQIKIGLALMPLTEPEVLAPIINLIDHVLIFSGNLGYQGGSVADTKLLTKIRWLKQHNPLLEIGWDGGVNDTNIARLVAGGVDLVNVGSFIQLAKSPETAYAKLEAALLNQ